MNLRLDLSSLSNEIREESPDLPFIPLGALSQGHILYDYGFDKKEDDVSYEETPVRNSFPRLRSQEHLFEYRAPEKLLENHSVIKNSILIDFEKRILRKSAIINAQKRVSFRESPRGSSSHRRSRSESKNLVSFRLELIINEEPSFVRNVVEEINEEVIHKFY